MLQVELDTHLNKVKAQYMYTYNKTDGANNSTNLTSNRIKEVGGVRLSDSSRLYMLVSHGSYHASIYHIHLPPHVGAVCLIHAVPV